MNKISVLILMIVTVLVVFSPRVLAKSESAGTGTANQNQVKTQNEGEEQQLEVQTAEQEEANVGTKSAAPRSENAFEHMSIVAKSVEEILVARTLKGGIGDQVRLIAQNQKQSQDQVRVQVGKIDSRGKFIKALIGTDYKALKNLELQVEQNQLRIEQLTELKNKLVNSGDIAMVQETINSLIEQNISLQEMISAEYRLGSVFGWLFRLFAK